MLNNVTLMGRLTKTPELKKTKNDCSVCSFSIAQNGKEKEEAQFFNCTAWRGSAEYIVNYFKKGDLVVINGRLQQDVFTDKNGVQRNNMTVVINNIYNVSGRSTETQTKTEETASTASSENVAENNTTNEPQQASNEELLEQQGFTVSNEDDLPF